MTTTTLIRLDRRKPPVSWVERDTNSTYVYEQAAPDSAPGQHGRCLGYALKRDDGAGWDVKLVGVGRPGVAADRDDAYQRLRELVGIDPASAVR